MRRLVVVAAAFFFAPAVVSAQEAGALPLALEAPPTAYAIPVESVALEDARGRLMETGGAAAGHALTVRQGGARMQVLTRTTSRVSRHFRFLRGEEDVLLAGVCSFRTEGHSLFGVELNRRTTQTYQCTFTDQPEGQYAMDVAIPAFGETTVGRGMLGVGIPDRVSEVEERAILRAKLLYRGVAYDALPTGFTKPGVLSRRSVQGYAVSRDGQAVGRIEFGGGDSKGTVTIPAADAEAREAVLFLLLNLYAMPDLYAPWTREQVMRAP